MNNPIPLRPSDVVLNPDRLGVHWPTGLSFARRLVRRLIAERWPISVAGFDIDANGVGEAIYHIDARGRLFSFVVFSQQLSETERTDRVIADSWDAAAALCEGELTAERLAHLRANVPKQEYGRADAQTLVWTRGNRSSRFFNHVVESLASGQQPDVDYLARGGYIMRSTAYYANTKFGLATYETIAPDHPLAGSYVAQMFAAFLFREFSCDLAEHIARGRAANGRFVPLAPDMRRFIGIGNATGMGLVPYVINNPAITHAWCWTREVALAKAKQRLISPTSPDVDRLLNRVRHLDSYFREDTTATKEFYTPQETLREILMQFEAQLLEFQASGMIANIATNQPWAAMCRWAEATEAIPIEGEELLHTALIDLYPDEFGALDAHLEVEEHRFLNATMSLGELRTLLQSDYKWALDLDLNRPEASQNFWYFSADSEEPLIGRRGKDPGDVVERPLDIPFQVQRLATDLADRPDDERIGTFLLSYPHHYGIIDRIQHLQGRPYAEIQTNLLDADFIPLHLQRFQLAMYGMERFSPQSIYWVRVTLMQGAPTRQDIATGWHDEQWSFPLRPQVMEHATP